MAVEWKQHIGEDDGVLGEGGSELILVGDEQDILCECVLEGLRVKMRLRVTGEGGGIKGRVRGGELGATLSCQLLWAAAAPREVRVRHSRLGTNNEVT